MSPARALMPTLAAASYTNFEVGQVHPLALTPSGQKLLVINTPDALLEIFTVQGDGTLAFAAALPVGLEPVSVTVRREGEAWVVNHLSDSVSIVDLAAGRVVATLTGSELRTGGLGAASCLANNLATPTCVDARPAPPPGEIHLYLALARNGCGSSGYGSGGGTPRPDLDPGPCAQP